MADRNFDDIVEKFAKNIYGTTKGKIREAVVWQDLSQLLESHFKGQTLRILDAGGGEGHFTRKLAAMGHQVILCDLSEEMLDRASELAQEQGISENIRFVNSSVQDIGLHLTEPVDLVIFHAVLEWISDQKYAIEQLADIIRPEGIFSVMFYNANGLVMRNAILGNFHLATPHIQRRRKRSLSPQKPLFPQQVDEWLLACDMEILGKSGVRVFHDYLQSRQLQQKDFPALLALEQQYCREEPYISMGRYIHVMARKQIQKDDL